MINNDLFISVIYFKLIGGGVWHLFLTSHLYMHELLTKYPGEKTLDPENTHEKVQDPQDQR